MKAKIRVATDLYEFIELEVEGSRDQIWDTYKDMKRMTIPVVGLAAKEWREALDKYLSDGSCEADVYAAMSEGQKLVIQEIKKAFSRIDSKEQKHGIHG